MTIPAYGLIPFEVLSKECWTIFYVDFIISFQKDCFAFRVYFAFRFIGNEGGTRQNATKTP